MDANKVGLFIAELRKQKGYTQKELAEKLMVTDKAISRWETGKGLPDTSLLKALSEILDVSVGELLSGEIIGDDRIKEKTDQIILGSLKYSKRMLLNMINVVLIAFGVIPLAFGEGDTKSRIKNVLSYKKPAFWIVVAAVVACIVLTVCLIANPRTDSLEWQPQPEIEDQDDYSEAVEAAMKSVKPEEVVVDDKGSNEKTALAWMEAWFDMLKALPKDNMAYISDGAVDRLKVIKVSKKGLPQAFVFSVTFSIRPTYRIERNAFWMAGNTGPSPGRDETWGQMSQEVELRLEDDGRYHFVYKGTGGVGNGNDYEDTSQQAAESWELLGNADVNRDGLKETIYLDKSQTDSGFVTLRVYDGSGNEIWSEQFATAHAGWNSLFLCELDGECYLLRYNPGMWQGYCTYTYSLFILEGGAEHVARSNTIEFDVNGVNKLDAPKMVAFAKEVNALLGKSTLLLSSEGGKYSFGPTSADQFFERYSWLDETPELYADSDDLETRLVKYSEYAVSNHRLYTVKTTVEINPLDRNEISEMILERPDKTLMVTDRKVIEEVTEKLTQVKVSKLSSEQEESFLDNTQRHAAGYTYSLTLQNEAHEAITYAVLLFNRDNKALMLVDVKTVKGNGKPDSYANAEDQKTLDYVSDIYNIAAAEASKDLLNKAKEKGINQIMLSTLGNLGYGDDEIMSLTPGELARIFAPGTHLDGGGFDPNEQQKAELAKIGIDTSMSVILANLGYEYEEMLKLSPEEIDFIFPNTELIANLVARGYNEHDVQTWAVFRSGKTYKEIIKEAMHKPEMD